MTQKKDIGIGMKKVQFLNNRQSRPAQILLPDCVSCLNLGVSVWIAIEMGAQQTGAISNCPKIGGFPDIHILLGRRERCWSASVRKMP